jgi:hypothetical protein
MTSSNLGPPIIKNINNSILYSHYASPQKDINSMCDGNFSLERVKYTTESSLLTQPLLKKWFGSEENRDASSIIARRKTIALGKHSYKTPIELTSHNNVNVISDALRRVRSSGYVTSKKIRNKPANGLTPSWEAGPLIRSENNTQCFSIQPKKINSMNPFWKTERGLTCNSSLLGDPVHGQYTTMRQKNIIPRRATHFDSGLYNRVRHENRDVTFLPQLYH